MLLGGKKRRGRAIGGIHPQRTHQLRGKLLVSTPPSLASAAYLPLIMSAAYLPLSMSARLAEGDVGTPRVARAERVLVDLVRVRVRVRVMVRVRVRLRGGSGLG